MAKKSRDNTRQLRILSQAAMLEEARTPYLVRTTMLIVCFSFIAFIAWASFTQITERSTAAGEIVPSGYVQSIQHLEGGIVEEILIRDDNKVDKGQILIRLEGSALLSDRERTQTRLQLLELQAARLHSFLNDDRAIYEAASNRHQQLSSSQGKILDAMIDAHTKEKELIRRQITQKKEQLNLLQQELATARKNLEVVEASFATQNQLYQERLVAETTYLNAVRELNNQQGKVDSLQIKLLQAKDLINEYEIRLQSSISTAKNMALQQLGEVEQELAESKELYEKLSNQVRRLALRAPTEGIVKGLSVHTVGGVIAPGSQLMEIVPTSGELLAEIKISPSDIGHIKVGDPAIIKITSYDFTRYGAIDGSISGLSATTFTDEQRRSYYKGMVTLDKDYLGNTPGKNRILPGMIVNADIITGEKSLLEYFLKPIHKALNSAFIER
ncbi:HlyD family type I secretion periplasmic adaptor subunit [Desulfogranum mediterraneum]|uniref:HlyD family type I secretion periplasmic adaptor subunit n=1 Tax=Desulfogranum mediterraneum TaxID=160661 RepID=UPI0009FF48B7|nr:HlyD family type I secretion periplasmic adaptor subunit [Desulfogranum mediterraneum]